MKRKTQLLLQASAVTVLATGLAACGNGNSTPTPTPGQTAAARQEDQFGIAFGNDFRADPNSEPAQVADGDVVAVSLTTEPVTIN
jgi:hypothetical protein